MDSGAELRFPVDRNRPKTPGSHVVLEINRPNGRRWGLPADHPRHASVTARLGGKRFSRKAVSRESRWPKFVALYYLQP